jgi:hypothetical protein
MRKKVRAATTRARVRHADTAVALPATPVSPAPAAPAAASVPPADPTAPAPPPRPDDDRLRLVNKIIRFVGETLVQGQWHSLDWSREKDHAGGGDRGECCTTQNAP